MVMDAVAEEHPLGIDDEIFPLLTFPGAGIIREYGLDGVAYREVETAVLVPGDVPPGLRRLAEVVDIFLLGEREPVPSRHLIAHYAQVGEGID